MMEEDLIAELSKYNWDRTNVLIAIRAKLRCEYCGKNMLESIDQYKLWQIDHIVPKCSGEMFCEDFDNKALSCTQCNKDFKGKWDPRLSEDVQFDREKYIMRIKEYIRNVREQKSIHLNEINKLFQDYFHHNKSTNDLTKNNY